MTVAELITALSDYPFDFPVCAVGSDGQTGLHIEGIEYACLDVDEWLICSLGTPPDAVDADGNEAGNNAVCLVVG